ncbi:MAG: GntR family transcriptional regulator [Deltaproteobacteria bacterium]|nr:MAG: GntR family transcriptional regulator [Deltaproteobacteria bacterium]
MILDAGPTPLYFQLKNILKSQITTQELKGQQRLPSEAELCIKYGISRATVRQALLELEKEGFIYRERGKGTFVTDQSGLKQLSLKGTIENLIAAGRGTRIKVLEYREVSPPLRVAEILRIKDNQDVFQLEIIRLTPKGPFGYSFIYLPPELGKTISRDEFSEATEFITLVEGKLSTRVHRASQTIDVALATEEVARNLSIKTESPLLVIERQYYARDGEPLFMSLTRFRPDLYKYRIELTRT